MCQAFSLFSHGVLLRMQGTAAVFYKKGKNGKASQMGAAIRPYVPSAKNHSPRLRGTRQFDRRVRKPLHSARISVPKIPNAKKPYLLAFSSFEGHIYFQRRNYFIFLL